VNFTEIKQAVNEAEATIRAIEFLASDIATLLDGRCRHVKTYSGVKALARIKKELADFNAQTHQWKGGAK
jgi:hypothetical protein